MTRSATRSGKDYSCLVARYALVRRLRIVTRRILQRSAAALAMVLAGVLAGCSDVSIPSPTALPLRPTEVADFETVELVELLQQLVDAGAPAALIEVRNGEEVWSEALGVASLKSELPAATNQTFRIASLTKPMVAAIVLQLVAEGEFELDSSVDELVPGMLEGAPAEVTVRQLLNHTSGLPEYVDALQPAGPRDLDTMLRTPHTDAELLALALAQPWLFAPGEGFAYSNSNYIALTMLIEQVTGVPLAESLRVRITEPLGLSHTSLPEGEQLSDSHLRGYWVEDQLRVDVTDQQSSLWSGAGGVESTIGEIATFERALVTGRVVPSELLGEMLALGADGYGLGMQGRVDSCPPGDAALLPFAEGLPTAGPDATGAATAEATVAETEAATEEAEPFDEFDPEATESVRVTNPPEPTSGSLMQSGDGPLAVQIGEPGFVYGHIGSGLGYRSLTFTSPDGVRQVTIAWTASPSDYGADPRMPIAYALADAALSVRC